MDADQGWLLRLLDKRVITTAEQTVLCRQQKQLLGWRNKKVLWCWLKFFDYNYVANWIQNKYTATTTTTTVGENNGENKCELTCEEVLVSY